MTKILITDDSTSNLATAKQALGGNANITFSSSAAETLELIKTGDYKFLATDLMFFETPAGELKKLYDEYLAMVERIMPPLSLAFASEGKIGTGGSKAEELYRLQTGKVSREFLRSVVVTNSGEIEGWLMNWAATTGEFETHGSLLQQTAACLLEHYRKIPLQFPLGIPLLLAQLRVNKNKGVIISNLHRHDTFLQGSGIVMLPLAYSMGTRDLFRMKEMMPGKFYYRANNLLEGKSGADNVSSLSLYMQDCEKETEEFWRALANSIAVLFE